MPLFGSMGQTLTIRHDSWDRSSYMPGVLLGTLIYSVLAAGVGVYLTPYLNLSICRFYLLATGNQAGGAEPPHTDPWDTPF